MLLVGLTGGIGSGKTEVLKAFAAAGAKTISTDAVVHEVLGTAEVRDQLVERWGEGVAPDGVVDRAAVAARVFDAPQELRWLESLLHPRVGARLAEWRAGMPAGTPLGVVEVPLLFETGMEAIFDATVTVVADDELRRQRAAARGHGEIEGRDARQLTQEEKARRATHVVENTGSLEDLHARVSVLAERLVTSRTET